MKLTAKAFLRRKTLEDKFKLFIRGKNEFEWKIIEMFGLSTKLSIGLDLSVKRNDTKTYEQLGYFHSEVLQKTWIAYKHLGWKLPSLNSAKELLKEHAGFYEDIINEKTGECKRYVKSISEFKIDEMTALIDFAINEVCANANITVNPPQKNKYGKTK